MTDTNTLSPCPFCGERAETDFISEHHSYQIECRDVFGCTARVTRDSELGAIEAWNRRAPAPASQPVAVPAGMEPVAHLIVRSAFRASQDGQDAEGNEWVEEAQSPEESGAFAVFTAAQVQAMLAAAPSAPRKLRDAERHGHYGAALLEIASLQAQLEAIGAGGVEPLRKWEKSEPVAWVRKIVLEMRAMDDAQGDLLRRSERVRMKRPADASEYVALYAAQELECGNCFEGKSDMDHDCRKCGGTGIAKPDAPPALSARWTTTV